MRTLILAPVLFLLCSSTLTTNRTFVGQKVSILMMDADMNVVSQTPEGKDVEVIYDPTLKSLGIIYTNTDGAMQIVKFNCWNQVGDKLRLVDTNGFKVTVKKTFIEDSMKDNILILLGDEVVNNKYLSAIAVSGFIEKK